MSPYYFYVGSSSSWAFVFFVNSSGDLNYNYVSWAVPGVRPAINISPEVTITGSGTMSDPYVVL